MTEPGTPDINEIIKQAQAMQAELQEAQKKITDQSFTGEMLDGKISVTVQGTGMITGVHIDPTVVDLDDIDELQDLIVAAAEQAHKKLASFAEDAMGPLSNALGQGGLGDTFGGQHS